MSRTWHEAGGPNGGTRGGYIDSFENMPGAQQHAFGATPPRRAFIPAVGDRLRVTAGPDGLWLEPAEAVSGLVCEVLAGPLAEAAIVVKLDRSLDVVSRSGRRVSGAWLVLEPAGSPSRWRRAGDSRAEVWSTPPAADPWLAAEVGAWVDDAAAYRFEPE
ncbi:MAG: hypothetical protein AAF548_16095 [Actinomycetota bacterium]